jgi:hypothetical protein
MSKRLTTLEELLYFAGCIFTFGLVWLIKIIIKAAVYEATLNANEKPARSPTA